MILHKLNNILLLTLYERLAQVLSFATTMLTDESKSLGLPDFPIDNLGGLVQIMVILIQIQAKIVKYKFTIPSTPLNRILDNGIIP